MDEDHEAGAAVKLRYRGRRMAEDQQGWRLEELLAALEFRVRGGTRC